MGTVLTTSSGLTLYRFTVDPKGKATCTGACAQVWPPYLAAKGARVVGPSGVTGFSLIAVGGGHWQVAYHGEALYRYAPDTAKGQAKGQGLQHLWYAVTKSGQSPAGTVSASGGASGGSGGQGRGATPTTPPTMAPTTTPTTASHASGGYGY